MAEIENKIIHERWLNNDEAARFLSISKRTLKKYRDLGYIPFSKCLRKIMFKRSDLIAYLNRFYNPVKIKK